MGSGRVKEISRRTFLEISLGAPAVIAANEGVKGLTGLGLDSLFLPLFLEAAPHVPFSPAFMHDYFLAECSPKITQIKEDVIREIKNHRPESVRQFLELGLEKASDYETSQEARVRSALFVLAAIGQVGPENGEARLHSPLYLPEGERPERPKKRLSLTGIDKVGHLTSAAFFAYRLLDLLEESEGLEGVIENRRADEFLISTSRANQLVGMERIQGVKDYLRCDHKRIFPYSPEIHCLTSVEATIAILLTNAGIAFEVFTTTDRLDDCFNPELVRQGARWIARQRITLCEEIIDQRIRQALKEPRGDLVSGLGDLNVTGDLTANGVGIWTGIDCYRQVKKGANPFKFSVIPFDDYTERYGLWQGQISSRGQLIGEPPHAYPQVSSYRLGFNLAGEAESSVTYY